jgi:hypothetical protein
VYVAGTYLSSCVDDLRRKILAIMLDHAAEGVLDGRVVTLHKMPLDILNGER